jgi:PleD family two-component response regulator
MPRQSEQERRHASDRRRFARGGRRPYDRDGYAPLVLVAADDVANRAHCEAILAALRFAVAPAHSVEEAVRVMHGLRPNVVVAHLKDNERLRAEMQQDPRTADVPLITIDGDASDPLEFISEIRRVLRSRNTLPYPQSRIVHQASHTKTGSGI